MDQPVGDPVITPAAKRPSPITLDGRTVKLVPLSAAHAKDIYPLFNNDHPDQTALWTYIPDGPYDHVSRLERDFTAKASFADPIFFTLIDTRPATDTTDKPVGYIALMNISPEHQRLEIGHVLFSRPIQKTTGATEAIYLLLKHSINDLGYRRVEWKCNALNAASRRAAARIGFQLEGVFRQHLIVKGRNRDTAWFSILSQEWEGGLNEGLEKWLDEGNFDRGGRQIRSLEEVRREISQE